MSIVTEKLFHQKIIKVEVGEGGGFGWDGVEGWGEMAHNCN